MTNHNKYENNTDR